jgi:hypothetical protein
MLQSICAFVSLQCFALESSHSHRALAGAKHARQQETVSTVSRSVKETVETVLNNVECFSTGLKPSVNERTFDAKPVCN